MSNKFLSIHLQSWSMTFKPCRLVPAAATSPKKTSSKKSSSCVSLVATQTMPMGSARSIFLERGQHLLACAKEGSGRGRKTTTKPASVKQEPTEVTTHEVSHAWHRRNHGLFRAGRMSILPIALEPLQIRSQNSKRHSLLDEKCAHTPGSGRPWKYHRSWRSVQSPGR